MKHIFTLCLIFFISFFTPYKGMTQRLPLVFIVMSYEHGNVCGQPQEDGVISALADAGFINGKTIIIKHFYMDTKRTYNTPEAIAQRGNLALQAVKKASPDVVVTIDDNAARTVMLPLIGTNIPVVFTGINKQPEDYNQQKHFMNSREKPGSNVTGVYEKRHIATAFKIMKVIIPSLQKVICLTDCSPTGKAARRQMQIELQAENAGIDYEIKVLRSFEDLQKTVEQINASPIIDAYYTALTLLKNKEKNTLTAPEIISYLVKHIKKPGMTANKAFIKLGLFGGVGVDFKAMGYCAGQKAAMILKGHPVATIPIEDANEYSIVLNLKRAKSLKIQIPPDILGAADELYGIR